jgi:hypothetical protein
MTENDSKEPARPVKPARRFVLKRGWVMTRRQLIEATSASQATFDRWREKGLTPLDTGTKEAMFLTDDVIDLWLTRKPRKGPPS